MAQKSLQELYQQAQNNLQCLQSDFERFTEYRSLGTLLENYVKGKDRQTLNNLNGIVDVIVDPFLKAIGTCEKTVTLIRDLLSGDAISTKYPPLTEANASLNLEKARTKHLKSTHNTEMLEADLHMHFQSSGLDEEVADYAVNNSEEVLFAVYDSLKKRYLPED